MFLGFGKPRTKADWDEIIKDLYRQLENAQGRLECDKSMYGNKQPAVIAADKNTIAHIKADIEIAKINRRNASGGNAGSSSSTPAVSRKRNTSGGSERNAKEAASNSANRRAITPVSINNSADVEDNEEERAEKRKEAEEREKQKQVIKDVKNAILLYVEEKTELSRAEMREELLKKYNCSLSTYVETEKSVLEPLYASLLNRKVLGDKTVNDGILDTLARLLEKDNELEIKERKRICKKAWITQLLTFPWGLFGLDRFYLRDTKYGILKLITLGGMDIWMIVDIFTARRRTKEYNAKLLEEKFGNNRPTI